MPAQTSNSFPSKRPRTEATAKKSIKFASVADIRSSLHIQNDTLVEGAYKLSSGHWFILLTLAQPSPVCVTS
jgi:hypothetical protein